MPPVHFNKLGDQEFEKVHIMKKATNATHILNQSHKRIARVQGFRDFTWFGCTINGTILVGTTYRRHLQNLQGGN